MARSHITHYYVTSLRTIACH